MKGATVNKLTARRFAGWERANICFAHEGAKRALNLTDAATLRPANKVQMLGDEFYLYYAAQHHYSLSGFRRSASVCLLSSVFWLKAQQGRRSLSANLTVLMDKLSRAKCRYRKTTKARGVQTWRHCEASLSKSASGCLAHKPTSGRR